MLESNGRPLVGLGNAQELVTRGVKNKECLSGCLESFLRASNKKNDLL